MIDIEELKNALAAADEAYLTGMSNKGTYKRACKDIDGVQAEVQYTDAGAEVTLCGETCKIAVPLWESSCSCPSRSVCRHIIGAILWLKENLSDAAEEESDMEEDEPPKPETMGQELRDALAGISLSAIRRALGRDVKRIVEDVRSGRIELTEGSVLSAKLSDGTAVRMLYPLEFSTCACHRKELCSHKAAAVLAWQVQQNLASPDDLTEQVQALSASDTAGVRIAAKQGYAALCEVLRWGQVRMPDNLPEHLEVSAVQCHSAKAADAERMLRDLGSRLSDCRERRAAFQPEVFLQKFCACAEHLTQLQTEPVTDALLGAFRKSYAEYSGDLEILPIGMRTVQGGDYEGEVYYFLNLDKHAEQRFLTVSDLRPVFYESTQKRGRRTQIVPWNLSAPLRSVMRSKMILKHAKISEGKLSTSQETLVAASFTANLDCDEIREITYSDFGKLARDIARKQPESEHRRLCFVHPQACEECCFDKHTQKLTMTLRDAHGSRITVQARHTAETKDLIDLLEHIGGRMMESPELCYTILASAYFEDGRLCLYPIEFYNFIRIPEEQNVPQEDVQEQGHYAGRVLSLIEDVQRYLCEIMQSGLQSAYGTDTGDKLAKRAGDYGLHGLQERLTAMNKAAEGYRHSLDESCDAAVSALTQTMQYLNAGRQRLEVLCALHNMRCDK